MPQLDIAVMDEAGKGYFRLNKTQKKSRPGLIVQLVYRGDEQRIGHFKRLDATGTE